MNRSKLRGLIAGISIATVVGVAGIAVAAFTQQVTTQNVQSGTATFKPLTLKGIADSNKLFPNQKTPVSIVVENKDNDVPIIITQITAVPLTDQDISGIDSQHVDYCRSMLTLTPGIAGQSIGAKATATIPAGEIQLLKEADNRCQGMTFSTKWTVQAQTNAQ